jgi:hypothetical protein
MSGPSKGIVRVTNHPRNDEWLLLKFGPDLNRMIGSFGPAQQALDLGGYVMHRDQLDALKNWCRYQSVTLLNESRSASEPTQALECANQITVTSKHTETHTETCCAPYPTGHIPKFCGACGQPANPVTFQGGEPLVGVKCPSCERINHGGPAYCIACGVPLPEHHLHASALPRVKREPAPIGEVIAELDPSAARARELLHAGTPARQEDER